MEEIAITQTKKWINDVVVGCNFCPFAAREVKRGSIYYELLSTTDPEVVLEACLGMMERLDNEPGIETALLILPEGFDDFEYYLDLVETADQLIADNEYEGIYQLASFHPQYLFAGSQLNDPANYTNRSPYPMLHFLREEALSKAIDSHPDIDGVPARNIAFANEKGLTYMQQLLAACFIQSS
jgi:hypothetical protein